MSSNPRFRIALVLFLTCSLVGCQCPSNLRSCRSNRDQLAADLSQCQTLLDQCQATGPSVCSVAGLLYYLYNYKVERLAAGDELTMEECNVSGSEFEVVQRFGTTGGTLTFHFLQVSDYDGDGIGSALMLMTNPKSGTVQSGQVLMELNGVPASLDVRQSCINLANALNLCGN